MKTLSAIGILIVHIVVYTSIMHMDCGSNQRLCMFYWGGVMWFIVCKWSDWKPRRISFP